MQNTSSGEDSYEVLSEIRTVDDTVRIVQQHLELTVAS
jgi:hypothetical protein